MAFPHPLLCWWTHDLYSYVNCCLQCSDEHGHTYIFLSNSFEYMILEVELRDYNRGEAYVKFTDCPMDFTCVLYKMLSCIQGGRMWWWHFLLFLKRDNQSDLVCILLGPAYIYYNDINVLDHLDRYQPKLSLVFLFSWWSCLGSLSAAVLGAEASFLTACLPVFLCAISSQPIHRNAPSLLLIYVI